MDQPGTGAATSREGWIIAAVCRDLEVSEERVRGQTRDHETVQARQLLCYVLYRAGFSISHVARLLTRDHSTVLHAVRQVERRATLAEEGQRLATAVLPFSNEPTWSGTEGAVPVQAVSFALGHALEDALLVRDMQAVRAYVCGTLLGRERVPAVQAAWGLHLVAAQPRVRVAVEEVLSLCGLPAYRGLIDLQLQRVGLR